MRVRLRALRGGIPPPHTRENTMNGIRVRWLIDDSTPAGCELFVVVVNKGETRIIARERREINAAALGVTGSIYGEIVADDTGEYARAAWEDACPLPAGARVIGDTAYPD